MAKTAEHKAKLSAATKLAKNTPEARRKRCAEDKNLNRFITTFIYPLMTSWDQFLKGDKQEVSGEFCTFSRYEDLEKLTPKQIKAKVEPRVRKGAVIRMAVSDLRKFGPNQEELFKKLFKMHSRGCFSKKEGKGFASGWVPNEPFYTEVRENMMQQFLDQGYIDPYDFVLMVDEGVKYATRYTMYEYNLLESGYYIVKGVVGSKKMVGPLANADIEGRRNALQAQVDVLNADKAREEELERQMNLMVPMELKSLRESRVAKIKVLNELNRRKAVIEQNFVNVINTLEKRKEQV